MRGVIIRAVVAVVGLLLIGAFIIDWNALVWGGSRRETNDAQLQGDLTRLSTRVPGYVAEVAITDDQPVHAGDLLYRIEDDDYRARVDRAKADVAQAAAGVALAEAQAAAQRAQVAAAVAETHANTAQLERARLERVRQEKLLGTESGLLRAYQAALAQERRYIATQSGDEDAVAAAKAQIQVLDAQVEQARATLKANQAALDLARINLGYTRIVAPRDGVVGSRLVRVGQFVAANTALITLVPLDDVWAVANYREQQLHAMQVGQPADIRVDAFPGVLFHGRVNSIEPGSQARSALLPPDRAVGNFTKIVQRIPVKITLDPGQPLRGRLVPGLSVETIVDTSAPGRPENAP